MYVRIIVKTMLISILFQLDVKEAKIVEDHPQWELSDDEEKEQEEESEDSDYSTEEEDSE